MRLGPITLPQDPKDAILYLNERLEDIYRSVLVLENSFNKVLYTAPDKPRDWMICIADGTSWDPGSGKGLYVYFDGAWHAAAV